MRPLPHTHTPRFPDQAPSSQESRASHCHPLVSWHRGRLESSNIRGGDCMTCKDPWFSLWYRVVARRGSLAKDCISLLPLASKLGPMTSLQSVLYQPRQIKSKGAFSPALPLPCSTGYTHRNSRLQGTTEPLTEGKSPSRELPPVSHTMKQN